MNTLGTWVMVSSLQLAGCACAGLMWANYFALEGIPAVGKGSAKHLLIFAALWLALSILAVLHARRAGAWDAKQ